MRCGIAGQGVARAACSGCTKLWKKPSTVNAETPLAETGAPSNLPRITASRRSKKGMSARSTDFVKACEHFLSPEHD